MMQLEKGCIRKSIDKSMDRKGLLCDPPGHRYLASPASKLDHGWVYISHTSLLFRYAHMVLDISFAEGLI